jgi:hypothetical protein
MHHVVHIIHGIVPPLISWLSYFDKNDNLIFILTRVIKFCYRWHTRSWQLASSLEVELPATDSLPVHVWGTPSWESSRCLHCCGECSTLWGILMGWSLAIFGEMISYVKVCWSLWRLLFALGVMVLSGQVGAMSQLAGQLRKRLTELLLVFWGTLWICFLRSWQLLWLECFWGATPSLTLSSRPGEDL